MRIPRLGHRKADPPQAAASATAAAAAAAAPQRVQLELDPSQLEELSSVFAAPRWMRDLGFASWLLAGCALLLVGLVWAMGALSTIVDPVLCGLVVATVASPAVARMEARGIPRLGGSLIILLCLLAVGVLVAILVIGGISSQSGQITSEANAAAGKVQTWLTSAGLSSSGSQSATSGTGSSVSDVLGTFLHGLAWGIRGLTSLAFFLSFALFGVFFMMKDGRAFRRFVEGHMPVPLPAAQIITGGVIGAMRRYFVGLTIIAVFNAVVVGLGALALGVPLAGTIAVVTAVTAYIPYIGAFVSGGFAVVLALGAKGTTTAAIMLVICLLANGTLQNILQPIAFGAALDLNPLLTLVVTIAAGCFFGMVGLILAAPLTSAAIHITRQLAEVQRAAAGGEPAGDAPDPSPP